MNWEFMNNMSPESKNTARKFSAVRIKFWSVKIFWLRDRHYVAIPDMEVWQRLARLVPDPPDGWTFPDVSYIPFTNELKTRITSAKYSSSVLQSIYIYICDNRFEYLSNACKWHLNRNVTFVDTEVEIIAFVPNAIVSSFLGRCQVLQSLFSCFNASIKVNFRSKSLNYYRSIDIFER